MTTWNWMQLFMKRTEWQKLTDLLLARVKYLVITELTIATLFAGCYEASDVMLKVSFLFSRLTCGLLKPKEPPSSFVAL
jgi:hypothetical protein